MNTDNIRVGDLVLHSGSVSLVRAVGGDILYVVDMDHDKLRYEIDKDTVVNHWSHAESTPVRASAGTPVTEGVTLIAHERNEQITKHGFTLEQDADLHPEGSLTEMAFSAYTLEGNGWGLSTERQRERLIVKTPIQRLAVCGALIAAEIDRLHGLEGDES